MPSVTLRGMIPPIPTPLRSDESIDTERLARFVEFLIGAGVHGLWVLGTTARFDQMTDANARIVADTVVQTNNGRLPLVLNVSDGGTARTRERARRFDDLPFDAYAVLPPWYQPMRPREVTGYFRSLGETLARPVVIYNAPWVCNQLSFEDLRTLAREPRIIGCKDVTTTLFRSLAWPRSERQAEDFSYLIGNALMANASELGVDGFVSALSNAFPEIAVAIWNASEAGDFPRAARLQAQLSRLGHAIEGGPMLACLEAVCRYRGLLERMLPAPYLSLGEEEAAAVVRAVEAIGIAPKIDGNPI